MRIKIRLSLPFLLLINNLLLAKEPPRGIISISIQKAGTHLLKKCIRKLVKNKFFCRPFRNQSDKIAIEVCNEIDFCTILPSPIVNYISHLDILPKTYLNGNENNKPIADGCIAHLIYSKNNAKILKNRLLANFLIIRDPRDQIISYARWKKERLAYSEIHHYSLDDIIFDQITTGNSNMHPFKCNIVGYYNLFLPWLKLKNFCLIKFENLVGPLGGGTKEQQLKEIKKIARHIGIQISQDEIEKISEEVFGGTWTFREGQIGSWKKIFTQEHIQAFKSISGAMQLLVDLGYEKDFSWGDLENKYI